MIIKENPWSQSFGKFNPHEWYGEYYKPIVVGISMGRI